MVKFDLSKVADDYFSSGNLFEAEKIYKQLLALNPKDKNALYKLAYINVGKRDFKIAEMFLDASFKLGTDLKSLNLLAYVKENLSKNYDAILMYEKILELEPSEILYSKIENLYIKCDLFDNAIATAIKHVKQYESINSYRRLFIFYLNLSKTSELKKLCDTIVEKFPNKGFTFNLLGIYHDFINNDLELAETMFQKAIKLGDTNTLFDLAKCYKKLKKYTDAEKCCKKVLNTYLDKNAILIFLSELEFEQKKMRKGYKYYFDKNISADIKKLKNKWDGKKDYFDETILLYLDESDADIIRNIRYIKLLENKFKEVIVVGQSCFKTLLENNQIKFYNYNDTNDIKYDKYVLSSELQYYLNLNFENILYADGYINANFKEINNTGLNVGLCWKPYGDTMEIINNETINIAECLKNIFDIKNVNFYSFQKNDIFDTLNKIPKIIDLSNDLNDYNQYAEYLKSMDLIISVDTSILHLAGALSIPTIGIIPFNSKWYWFNNDKKTEWYSSIELIKQGRTNDWNNISEKIIKKIGILSEDKSKK